MALNFCTNCGQALSVSVPAGDDRPRHLCASCGTIHYQNPRMVVGCIPEWDGLILLCRRAIEPCHGLWTLPAGYLENGETVTECAIRETREEACADIEHLQPYALYSIGHISQVYLMFRADLKDGAFAPGEESLEVALFQEREVPWDRIAFRVIAATLRRYFKDLAAGEFNFEVGEILPQDFRTSAES
jgi:ADP-ribose pyrophosphatase YjhB (NUDIX family)